MSGRVPYRVAGEAQRAANERAREHDLSAGDLAVLAAVLDQTTSYSKLDDHVRVADLAGLAGLSVRQTQRALHRLAQADILVYQPGNGAGRLSYLAVPEADDDWRRTSSQGAREKGDTQVSTFSRAKGDISDHKSEERVTDSTEKGDILSQERVTPTRARGDREEDLEGPRNQMHRIVSPARNDHVSPVLVQDNCPTCDERTVHELRSNGSVVCLGCVERFRPPALPENGS